MINTNSSSDMITSAMKDLGLSLDDIITLMKGYEKFTESSDEKRKELMSGIKQLLRSH
jgi:DNA-binding transcriptional MerR regulator